MAINCLPIFLKPKQFNVNNTIVWSKIYLLIKLKHWIPHKHHRHLWTAQIFQFRCWTDFPAFVKLFLQLPPGYDITKKNSVDVVYFYLVLTYLNTWFLRRTNLTQFVSTDVETKLILHTFGRWINTKENKSAEILKPVKGYNRRIRWIMNTERRWVQLSEDKEGNWRQQIMMYGCDNLFSVTGCVPYWNWVRILPMISGNAGLYLGKFKFTSLTL